MIKLLILAAVCNQPVSDIDKAFAGRPGCFVLIQVGKAPEVFNPRQAAKRLPPYSTFKIPNTLIALESNVISSAKDAFKWQGEKHPGRPEVEHDYLMRDAFQESVLWVYQSIARKVGKERYKPWLKTFSYGNQDISGPLDQFWLGSSLRISALEQVRFLSKLATNKLGIKTKTFKTMEEIALADQGKGWQLFAKTGSARSNLNWYVGWIRRGPQTFVFAMNMEGPTANRKTAMSITKSILKTRKLID